jgi:predicted O-methyltransferase YrrM
MIDLTFANTIPGMTCSEELIVLSNLASLVPKNGKILEIGSFLGRSCAALHAGKDPSVSLTVIDPWPWHPSRRQEPYFEGDPALYDAAVDRSMEAGTFRAGFELCLSKILHDIKILQIDSKTFSNHGQYDLIFIDGDHDEPEYDIDNSIKNNHTLVIGDDFFHDHFPNVRKSVMAASKDRILVYHKSHRTKIWSLIPTAGHWRDNINAVVDAMTLKPSLDSKTGLASDV